MVPIGEVIAALHPVPTSEHVKGFPYRGDCRSLSISVRSMAFMRVW